MRSFVTAASSRSSKPDLENSGAFARSGEQRCRLAMEARSFRVVVRRVHDFRARLFAAVDDVNGLPQAGATVSQQADPHVTAQRRAEDR